jgi:predicted lipid-binding transport protein (Tim44 family)
VFDIYTIIFLVIAVVIFLRLRSVLGQRTGLERPPQIFEKTVERDDEAGGDKVVSLSRHAKRKDEDLDQMLQGIADKDSSLDKALRCVMAEDSQFNPSEFLQGAKAAYEMIVVAFAEGDSKTLKDLLSKDVMQGFQAAINERKERGETVDLTMIGIDKAKIIEASMDNKEALLTVRFKSQLINVVRDKNGEIVSGDPAQIEDVVDIWTFARNVASADPNWKLVATETAPTDLTSE